MSTGQVSDKTCIWGLTVISSRDDWGWELSSSSPSAMLRGAGAPWKQALLWVKVKVFITQSCPTLCDPMDCSSPGSSVHGDSPGVNTGVGCHALLPINNPYIFKINFVKFRNLWTWHRGDVFREGSSMLNKRVKPQHQTHAQKQGRAHSEDHNQDSG